MPNTETNAVSIWQALQNWANELAPWQRKIIASAVDHSKLTDQDVDRIYADFLGSAPEEASLSFTPATANEGPAPLRLEKIDELNGVNALPANCGIDFGPQLTVIFGANGTGKSGFSRVLANSCFSRSHGKILPNVYAAQSQPAYSAKFHFSLDGQAQQPIVVPQQRDVDELRRITIFDAMVARHHISQPTTFEFRPRGFDVFVEMARVYAILAQRLNAEMEARSHGTNFSPFFIGRSTIVSDAIGSLSADSDLTQLRAFATYGETERARFVQVDQQLIALTLNSPQEILRTLAAEKEDIESLIGKLGALQDAFNQERVAYRNTLVDNLIDAERVAEALGSDAFRRPFFRAVGTREWENFLRAAHMLSKRESDVYPGPDDRCLLCERPLDEASRDHVAQLLAFIEGDAQRRSAAAHEAVDTEVSGLRALELNFFLEESRLRSQIRRHDTAYEIAVHESCDSFRSARERAIQALVAKTHSTEIADAGEAILLLRSLLTNINSDIERLSATDTSVAVASLETERQTLRHREVLSGVIGQIEERVENLKWIRMAETKRSWLNTRSITDKEKQLFGEIVTPSYVEKFREECGLLDCSLPVELQMVGRSGQTRRELVAGGHKADEVLSEGEQRAVALADFLTEIAINPRAAGIVLDDPVTSLDIDRKKLIAERLASEAAQRQVIVFTHDLIFLNQLLSRAQEIGINVCTHWIQRDSEGQPGNVAKDDCPLIEKVFRDTRQAKDALARARGLTGSVRAQAIANGMGALRRILEVAVYDHVLKKTVVRWEEQIHVTALRRIKWDPTRIEELCLLYEDISRFIDAHSHSDEATGAPPEIQELSKQIDKVDALIAWAKSDRAIG